MTTSINIVFYTNCQSAGIIPNLYLNMKNINVIHLTNYQMINTKSPLPYDILNSCDIFIYQPIDKKHNIYSTDNQVDTNIISCLSSNCLKISFPYLYNSGIWGITKDAIQNDDGTMQNREVILQLKQNGKTLSDIIEMYYDNTINFKYKERFESSLLTLQEKEKKCDVQVSEFILNNIKKQKLFLTQNHPTPYLFQHVSEKIINIIKTKFTTFINDILSFTDQNHLPSTRWPICKNDILFWNFEYIDKADIDADQYYIEIISKYYNSYMTINDGVPDVYY